MKARLKSVKNKVEWKVWKANQALKNQSGEGFVDTAIFF